MILKNAERKLREAELFLNKIIDQERMAFNHKEQFSGYLSAFLSAGMSIRKAFHVKQDRKLNEAVKKWKEAWEAKLMPEEQRLWDFMRQDRNHEVHGSGASHTVGTENRELGPGDHKLASGTHTVAGLPDWPPMIIRTPAYYFTINGTDRKVTEACGEYFSLLDRMVADFRASSP